MKSLLLLFSFLLSILSTKSQTPALTWQHSYGGSGEDYTRTIQLTPDGGFAFLSAVESEDGDVVGNHGIYDYWLVKVDASGNQQWQKCYGGSNEDYGYEMKTTLDGGYIIALEKRDPADPTGYESAKEKYAKNNQNQQRRIAFVEWMRDRRKEAKASTG